MQDDFSFGKYLKKVIGWITGRLNNWIQTYSQIPSSYCAIIWWVTPVNIQKSAVNPKQREKKE